MGTLLSAQTCVGSNELSHSSRPEGVSLKPAYKTKSSAKHLTNTDEFISQYGSHFTCSSSYSFNSSSSSTSSSSSSYPSTSSVTKLNSHSNTKSHSSDSTTIKSFAPESSQHTATTSYSLTESMKNVGHQSQATFITHICVEDKCQVIHCDALRRIIQGLQWRSKVENGDAYGINLPQEFDGEYKNLMDDYQHLLMEHLFQLDVVRDEVLKCVTPCDLNNCASFKRYTAICGKDLSLCGDTQFFLNILDLIHCYIIHSTNAEQY